MFESARRPFATPLRLDRPAWHRSAFNATRLVVLLAAVGAFVLTAASAAPSHAAVETVARVDAQRYAGTWFEVARVPNRFQAKCESDVTATYQPMADGSTTVINRCRGGDARWDVATGRAVPAQDDASGARLKVSFLPAWLRWLPGTQGDYWVVMLDDDYRYSVVSDPQRRYLWILSRTPALPEQVLDGVVSRLRAQGYPVDSLVPTVHRPRDQEPALARRTQLII